MGKGEVDAIVINASGCGTMVKDYGHLLQRDPAYAERAAKISDMTRDISEFLSEYDLGPPKRWSSLKVAYHSACSLQHGQRVTDEPKTLLRNAGYTVSDIPEGHICCGSAGTYNILQPEIAGELRGRKARNIRSVKPDVVAAGNIGCISQLAPALDAHRAHGRTPRLGLWRAGAARAGASGAIRDRRAGTAPRGRGLHQRVKGPAGTGGTVCEPRVLR